MAVVVVVVEMVKMDWKQRQKVVEQKEQEGQEEGSDPCSVGMRGMDPLACGRVPVGALRRDCSRLRRKWAEERWPWRKKKRLLRDRPYRSATPQH